MRVIAHLGLPKTASTMLQNQYFCHLTENTKFLGKATEPRYVSSALRDLRRWLDGSGTKQEFRRHVSELFTTADSVLLSDEMILVDTPRMTWQAKVERVAEAFENERLTISIVLREPLEWAYSLFVELLPTLRDPYRSLETFLLESNQTRLADYVYLNDHLEKCFPASEIRYFSFRRLLEPGGVAAFVESLSLVLDKDTLPRRSNDKVVTSSGYMSSRESMKQVLGRSRFMVFVRRKLPRASYSVLAALAHLIPAGGSRVVPFPSQSLRTAFYKARCRELGEFSGRYGLDLSPTGWLSESEVENRGG